MTDDNPTDGATTSSGKVEFIQYHKPGLIAGDYEISVTQKVATIADGKIPPESFPASRGFVVLGERFELKPEDIYALFPPEGSVGDHSNALPHLVLNRSTLPWERRANPASDLAPWLALLLFDQLEAPTPQVITLGELKNGSDSTIKFPGFSFEYEQSEQDKVTVIDVQKSLLQTLLPAEEELELLAHVRQGKDTQGDQTVGETAVIIGNRLPRRGAISVAHLVSVEERYTGGGFDYQQALDDDRIRLVSLKSWSFACADEAHNFKSLLTHLNLQPGTLRLPAGPSPEAEKYLSMGYVPLTHYLRRGAQTVSWYHGPLSPAGNPLEISLPAPAADQLVRYDPSSGLFDISYAAAWELGRLLALQSKQFSVSLYNWKRAHAQHLGYDEQRLLHPHLPMYEQTTGGEEEQIPADISSWFYNLSLLQGVPFNYLVPDERMLPPESLRFFLMDNPWIDCLLDGAFSIGRVTTSDYEQDQSQADSPAANPHDQLSGFLLRSEVVAGWPGLLVDAYADLDKATKLDSLRMERLSDNVLICLFAGEAQVVEIHQQPEALHFGLDETEASPPTYYKKLRDSAGKEGNLRVDSIPWRQESARVINIAALADAIVDSLDDPTRSKMNLPPITSSQYALQMIEGVEKISFSKANSE
ncbi:MAG TPA: hypothetical protein VJ464_27970 [Blastocatellia bacterium]|nr:hypothetical protein [Blastocatellia bacterium]